MKKSNKKYIKIAIERVQNLIPNIKSYINFAKKDIYKVNSDDFKYGWNIKNLGRGYFISWIENEELANNQEPNKIFITNDFNRVFILPNQGGACWYEIKNNKVVDIIKSWNNKEYYKECDWLNLLK